MIAYDKNHAADERSVYEKSKKFGYCDFEIDPIDSTLWGYICASAYEGGPSKGEQDAKTIVACNEDLYVKVKWHLWGHLVHHMCGYFCVCVYLKSIGPGKDYNLDCDGDGKPCLELIPMDPCGDGYYEVECKIPARSIDCGDCGTLYEVAVTLTALNACKKPGHIAAYCKGPCIMFYEPERTYGSAPAGTETAT
jgi:hypothetical protein